jgi:hypothetical protein
LAFYFKVWLKGGKETTDQRPFKFARDAREAGRHGWEHPATVKVWIIDQDGLCVYDARDLTSRCSGNRCR